MNSVRQPPKAAAGLELFHRFAALLGFARGSYLCVFAPLREIFLAFLTRVLRRDVCYSQRRTRCR